MDIGIGRKNGQEILFNDPLPGNINILEISHAHTLMDRLYSGELAAGVRGNLSSSGLIGELKERDLEPRRAAIILQEGRLKYLLPVGIDEGITSRGRVEMVLLACEHMRKLRRILAEESGQVDSREDISIGVLSAGRPGDVGRSPGVDRSIGEGREIVESCRREGLDARLYGIEVEKALPESDIVVAPDGIVGNYLFRTLYHFSEPGRFLFMGAIYLGLPFILVDSSRSRTCFDGPVKLAAMLAGSSNTLFDIQ